MSGAPVAAAAAGAFDMVANPLDDVDEIGMGLLLSAWEIARGDVPPVKTRGGGPWAWRMLRRDDEDDVNDDVDLDLIVDAMVMEVEVEVLDNRADAAARCDDGWRRTSMQVAMMWIVVVDN
jgi:hypothetical protein